jgi:hypothetical protein
VLRLVAVAAAVAVGVHLLVVLPSAGESPPLPPTAAESAQRPPAHAEGGAHAHLSTALCVAVLAAAVLLGMARPVWRRQRVVTARPPTAAMRAPDRLPRLLRPPGRVDDGVVLLV